MSDKESRIVITGFMAAGKTSVAKALAERMNCRMIDLDFIITEREKRSVPALITEEGEARFREAEGRALRVVLEMNRARVIALGGGAWTIHENRALIAEHDCLTVWLDAPFELCWQRITESEESRPLAKDREAAERLFHERRALYTLARLRIEVTTEKSAEDLAAEIISAL
ncbi:MAG TPA: shikimate kinase [Pyrinomonadaceae bacterium]|nr:shikimate kinase [Pyrinomonadaceae bacterium]